jgi:nitroreductase
MMAASGRDNVRNVIAFEPIALPEPDLKGGVSLADAFRLRRTEREFSDRPLSRQMLSNCLWAACGINRINGPFGLSGRTAASASNSQEVDVYVALQSGIFRYEPSPPHGLIPIIVGDLRRLALGARQQDGGLNAPVRLIYVADIGKLEHTRGFDEPGLHDPDVQKSYYCVDIGLIAGNVYLFAATCGLAAWFHNCDRPALSAKLGLDDHHRPLFGQTIGYRR